MRYIMAFKASLNYIIFCLDNGVHSTNILVITLFVARILSPDDYGLFGMASLITSSLVIFNELGLGASYYSKKGHN